MIRTAALILAGALATLGASGSVALAQGTSCKPTATQIELTQCADAAYKRADAKLNAAYKTAMAKAKAKGAGDATALRDAQRKWIGKRDATCDAEGAEYGGGSMASLAILQCRERLTRERTAQLERGTY